MYQWLFNVLAVSALLSAVVVLYQVISFAVTNRDAQWRTTWIWPAFWQLLYFVVLLALAALWRATHNNTRYAYADVRGDGDDHEPLDVELEQPSGLAGVVLRVRSFLFALLLLLLFIASCSPALSPSYSMPLTILILKLWSPTPNHPLKNHNNLLPPQRTNKITLINSHFFSQFLFIYIFNINF